MNQLLSLYISVPCAGGVDVGDTIVVVVLSAVVTPMNKKLLHLSGVKIKYRRSASYETGVGACI